MAKNGKVRTQVKDFQPKAPTADKAPESQNGKSHVTAFMSSKEYESSVQGFYADTMEPEAREAARVFEYIAKTLPESIRKHLPAAMPRLLVNFEETRRGCAATYHTSRSTVDVVDDMGWLVSVDGKAKTEIKNVMGWVDQYGENLDLIKIASRHLNRPWLELVETFYHESAHYIAAACGWKDSSHNYHNGTFEWIANQLGLLIDPETLDENGKPKDKRRGYNVTLLSEFLKQKLLENLGSNEAAFSKWKVDADFPTKAKKVVYKYECECFVAGSEKVHVSFRATNPNLHMRCEDCDTEAAIVNK